MASPSEAHGPGSELRTPRSGLGSELRTPRSGPGSELRTPRNGSGSELRTPRSGLHTPRSGLHTPRSELHTPRSGLHTPRGGLRTPRASLLGLDTLAKNKRAAALESPNGNGGRKRFRLDDGDEPFFKGMVSTLVFWSKIYRKSS